MKERTRELPVETVKNALIVLRRLSKHTRSINAQQTKLFSSPSKYIRHPRSQNFSRLFANFGQKFKKIHLHIFTRLVCIHECIAIFSIITRAS